MDTEDNEGGLGVSETISIVIFILQVILCAIIFPFYFIYLRNEPIIKARSMVLEGFYYFLSIAFQVRMHMSIVSSTGNLNCIGLVWSSWIVSII